MTAAVDSSRGFDENGNFKLDGPGPNRTGIIFARQYKPSTLDEEVLYSARIVGSTMELTKWDGHREPLETYRISMKGKGKCNCQGSSRQPYCKHRKLVDQWEKVTATNFVGEFYDYATGTCYTPADQEGIPLTGVVNIHA